MVGELKGFRGRAFRRWPELHFAVLSTDTQTCLRLPPATCPLSPRVWARPSLWSSACSAWACCQSASALESWKTSGQGSRGGGCASATSLQVRWRRLGPFPKCCSCWSSAVTAVGPRQLRPPAAAVAPELQRCLPVAPAVLQRGMPSRLGSPPAWSSQTWMPGWAPLPSPPTRSTPRHVRVGSCLDSEALLHLFGRLEVAGWRGCASVPPAGIAISSASYTVSSASFLPSLAHHPPLIPPPQNLQGSLMALCDDPSAVSTGQSWAGVRQRGRVPIYVTANDLSCLYAVSGVAGHASGDRVRGRLEHHAAVSAVSRGCLKSNLPACRALRICGGPLFACLQPLVREGRMDK